MRVVLCGGTHYLHVGRAYLQMGYCEYCSAAAGLPTSERLNDLNLAAPRLQTSQAA